MIQPTCRFIMW